ncbi:hypothetical protein DJ013_02255 [Arcticibacterium luteifluviistationis]|uniref:Uncharacterized protein n=1 Tax=Arcticibacterium luteifluviistationis TaxID=1784714 RepID=A0A2Z4G7I0_9BACT|nr:hypothetical protein DJ013_02255 [Arcticibacterium luteifluviistationis]
MYVFYLHVCFKAFYSLYGYKSSNSGLKAFTLVFLEGGLLMVHYQEVNYYFHLRLCRTARGDFS